jgi:hypothetical protein
LISKQTTNRTNCMVKKMNLKLYNWDRIEWYSCIETWTILFSKSSMMIAYVSHIMNCTLKRIHILHTNLIQRSTQKYTSSTRTSNVHNNVPSLFPVDLADNAPKSMTFTPYYCQV